MKILAVVLAALGLGLIVAACDEVLPPAPMPPDDGDPPRRTPPDGPDDRRPTLTTADMSGAEGDDQISFTVRLDHAGSEQVVVSYATEDTTATAGSDFRAVSGTLTFPANSAGGARQIDVPLIDDQDHEGDETFRLVLSNPQGATLATSAATGTIVDDDAPAIDDNVPAIIVQPAELTVTEGASGTYTVVLGTRPTGPVTVAVAADGDELTTAPANLRFTADDSDRPQTVTVRAMQDPDALADPPIPITHTATGGGYDNAAATVTATIVEDDVATLAAAAARADEKGVLAFEVTLSLAVDREVAVDYATGAAGDTATEGRDYAAARGALTFAARSTAPQTVTVAVRDDTLDEPDEEHLTLVLSNPRNATLAGGGDTLTATGVIEDDDALPRVSIEDAIGSEGSDALRFPVRLAPASAREVTVRYATADGSATANDDYTPASGTLTFPAGTTERTVAVAIVDDALDEEDRETLQVTLSAPVNAELPRDPTATGTVTDDDPFPQAAVADASAQEDGGALRFTVRLAPVSGRIVTVDYATRDGSAAAGSDYESAVGTLTFPPGSTTRTIDVSVTDDQVHEGDEALTLVLSNPRNATLAGGGDTLTATGVIADDGPLPRVSIEDASGSEGSDALRFPVRLVPASAREVTVRYATADGSATANEDYAPASGTLSFPAGTTERTLAVAIVDDSLDEEDRETLQVTLNAPVNAELGVPAATGTVIDDDPLPQAAVADASAREADGALRFTVRLDPPSGRAVTVDYATRDGSAAAGSDYEPAAGTLTFSPGATTRTIDVRVTDDQGP